MANVIEKSIQRHVKKAAQRKVPEVSIPVPRGCGMGWPEMKDWNGPGDINDDDNPCHDQKKWLLP